MSPRATGPITFDRVSPRVEPTATHSSVGHDEQGKRALFSGTALSDSKESGASGLGSARVECSRCEAATVVGLGQLIRLMVPSFHLGVRIGRGDDVHTVGLLKRDYPSYLRCPACRRRAWTRLTLQI